MSLSVSSCSYFAVRLVVRSLIYFSLLCVIIVRRFAPRLASRSPRRAHRSSRFLRFLFFGSWRLSGRRERAVGGVGRGWGVIRNKSYKIISAAQRRMPTHERLSGQATRTVLMPGGGDELQRRSAAHSCRSRHGGSL